MVFSSIAFLFAFLPAVLWVYYISPRRLRNLFLLGASLFFYTWGGGALVLVLIGSIAFNYLLGARIERAVDEDRGSAARRYLGVAVAGNVGVLVFFKYTSFATATLASWFEFVGIPDLPVLDILLPIGISFYTFQSISYVIDVYRGTARHLVNPVDFALYIALFPQIIAGPIVRFHQIRDQLLERTESSHRFARGITRFAHGLAKKVIIADTVAPAVVEVFSTPTAELNTATAVFGIVAYAVQLYFDFSAYSDMAIGIGEMLGFRFPENFDRPYASRSVTEFWRRWHMSLSNWFRDYLYIPLGGNRGTELQTYRNLVLVFVATGLWHGADWTFLVWGCYHGVLLLVERRLEIGRDPSARAGVIAQARTVGLVLLGWVFFRSPDLHYAMGYFGALLNPAGWILPEVTRALGTTGLIALAIGIATVALPRTWVTGVRLELDPSPLAGALRFLVVTVALPVALIMAVSGTFSPFLYFRF